MGCDANEQAVIARRWHRPDPGRATSWQRLGPSQHLSMSNGRMR